MSGTAKATDWFPWDAYERSARLNPALVFALPLLWTGPSLKAALGGGALGTILVSLGITIAAASLFMNIARARGKALEPKLNAAWGGLRTTALLRHRDTTVDRFTKARYHKALEVVCKGHKLPSEADESTSPAEADERFHAATTKLREKRRDPKYVLLHKENRQYGFRRNLLGLKPLALALVGGALVIDVTLWWTGLPSPLSGAHELAADAGARWSIYAAIGSDLAMAAVWLVIVRPDFVRLAATEYAIALFRTLDA